MIELRLHRKLYREASVDEAVAVYGTFATVERAEDAVRWIVRVTAASPARERRVAGELANYALGRTITAGAGGAGAARGPSA